MGLVNGLLLLAELAADLTAAVAELDDERSSESDESFPALHCSCATANTPCRASSSNSSPSEFQCPAPAALRARPPVNSTSGNASRNNNPTTRNTSLKASREACRPTWSLSSCRA